MTERERLDLYTSIVPNERQLTIQQMPFYAFIHYSLNTFTGREWGSGKVNTKEGFFKDGKAKPFTEKDFRFTNKNGCVYAFQMKPTAGSSVIIKEFKEIAEDMLINSVTLLETGEKLSFEQNKKHIEIKLNSRLSTNLPVCFKIEIG